MRITRRKLIELAQDEAHGRAASGGLISAYLIGTVAHGEPLLGDTADIDMVLIHEEPPTQEREIIRLSHQVHFDIAHHHKLDYEKPSQLRIDPWLGPALCEPVFLYDPDHFFEWAQAGARGQYYRADHTHARAQAFLARARRQASLLQLSGRWVRTYLMAAFAAANSIASLHKFPVAGRRLTLSLKEQTQSLNLPEVYGRFLKLIGADLVHDWSISELFQPWAHAFDAAARSNNDVLLVDCRKDYYLRGFQSLSDQGHQKAVLWPLLYTWERAIHAINMHLDDDRHLEAWHKALETAGLDDSWHKRREAELLDYLEFVDLQLDEWADNHGA
ncbi:MAG: hypothetical protein PVF85_01450 [Anaerolineales bacterium]